MIEQWRLACTPRGDPRRQLTFPDCDEEVAPACQRASNKILSTRYQDESREFSSADCTGERGKYKLKNIRRLGRGEGKSEREVSGSVSTERRESRRADRSRRVCTLGTFPLDITQVEFLTLLRHRSRDTSAQLLNGAPELAAG